mgnify:CR=1 FL=1
MRFVRWAARLSLRRIEKLVCAGEICFINPPGIFIPPEVSHTHASHDKPWATFESTAPTIFSNTGPVAPKPVDEGPTALDEEMLAQEVRCRRRSAAHLR